MSEQERVKLVCPECGGPLPPEAAHRAVKCERCGVASVPAPKPGAAVEAGVAPCPRCSGRLFEGFAGEVRLLGCGACGGVFLDNEASTRITRARDEAVAALARRAKERAPATIDTRPDDLPCPVCSAAMRRVQSRGLVDLDICGEHGTWFDRGELNRVMDAYARSIEVSQVGARDDSELRMAQFRDEQRAAIAAAEDTSAAGAFGVTAGLLGVLAVLAGSSSRS